MLYQKVNSKVMWFGRNIILCLFLLTSFFIASCGVSTPVSTPTTITPDISATQPNIIFILADDLGWGDVGYNGSEIKTPNIDALAADGVTLEHGYAFPICSPTRAALLSGQNPLRFGIDGPMENDAMLAEELTLLPTYLRDAGYETWLVGKWHLGMAKVSAMPQSRGFDHFYGALGGFIDYYTHVYFGGLDWQRNGVSIKEQGYSTDLLTAEALRLVSERKTNAKPFFLYLSYNAPHTPLQYPPSREHEYPEIESADRRVFAQMTTHMDAAIGEFLHTLEEQEILDNTLVVFMSDNGGNLHAGASNGRLREGKGSAYEGGVRVPAIIKWPNALQGKRVYQQPVFVQDWLPTLLDASGTEYTQQDFDGRSVWQNLVNHKSIPDTNSSGEFPFNPVILGTAKSKAVYDWPLKFIPQNASKSQPAQNELYNIELDPDETNNIAEQHPDKIQFLNTYLKQMPTRESKAARGPPPESLFRKEDGSFDYDIRKPVTREPWADAALDE